MNDDKYDYYAAVRSDAEDYLEENYEGPIEDETDAYDDMFVSDSVTGNASGSYYCNTWQAESALCHNSGLLAEAIEEFGSCKPDPESQDVTIRCYVLGQVLHDVVEEYNSKFDDEDDEDDE